MSCFIIKIKIDILPIFCPLSAIEKLFASKQKNGGIRCRKLSLTIYKNVELQIANNYFLIQGK